jgi:predicted RNase H-like nuclease (RuvC/YqgF family)
MAGEPVKDHRNFGGANPETQLAFAFKAWQKGTLESEKQHVIPTKEYADLIITYNEMKDLPKNTETVSILIDLYFNQPEKFQKIKEKLSSGEQIERLLSKESQERKIDRKIDCLHCLIKQLNQKLGRKIKVICD